MDEIDQTGVGGLKSAFPDAGQPSRRVSRLLLLWPIVGIVGLLYAMDTYPPLDHTLMYWIGGIPCFISLGLINAAWKRSQNGVDVGSFFPGAVWLAIGCLSVPTVLLINGALDHSPVEQHRQTITHTSFTRGRGGTSYYLECSSWRGHSDEKMAVSHRQYLEFHSGDQVIVETRRGALGIPWLISVRRSV